MPRGFLGDGPDGRRSRPRGRESTSSGDADGEVRRGAGAPAPLGPPPCGCPCSTCADPWSVALQRTTAPVLAYVALTGLLAVAVAAAADPTAQWFSGLFVAANLATVPAMLGAFHAAVPKAHAVGLLAVGGLVGLALACAHTAAVLRAGGYLDAELWRGGGAAPRPPSAMVWTPLAAYAPLLELCLAALSAAAAAAAACFGAPRA